MIKRTFCYYLYRVNLVVADLGRVDFNFDVPPSCPAVRPILPNTCVPKQNWADNGTPRIRVNPTRFTMQFGKCIFLTIRILISQKCGRFSLIGTCDSMMEDFCIWADIVTCLDWVDNCGCCRRGGRLVLPRGRGGLVLPDGLEFGQPQRQALPCGLLRILSRQLVHYIKRSN